MITNYKQLTFAREYKGLTQMDLAKSIKGLSQSNLSKFEKGICTLSSMRQAQIIDRLGFPREFYDLKLNTSIIYDFERHVKRRAKKSDVTKVVSKIMLIGHLIDTFSGDINGISHEIDWLGLKFVQLDVDDGFSPEYIARRNRKVLDVGIGEPLDDLIAHLEWLGIIVYEVSANNFFEGYSFYTQKGHAVIAINTNLSNELRRFVIARELGRLVMHSELNNPISIFRDLERELDEFANEFIMPASFIKNDLFDLKLNELRGLKRKWCVSMPLIIKRAKDLNCISSRRSTNLTIELSRAGLLKPNDYDLPSDKPTSLRAALDLIKTTLGYTDNEICKCLSIDNSTLTELLETVCANHMKLKISRFIEP